MTEPTPPAPAGTTTVSSIRRGTSVADLKQSFIDNLACALGRGPALATRHDLYAALALTVLCRAPTWWTSTSGARSITSPGKGWARPSAASPSASGASWRP